MAQAVGTDGTVGWQRSRWSIPQEVPRYFVLHRVQAGSAALLAYPAQFGGGGGAAWS
jgi:hypothetical protein